MSIFKTFLKAIEIMTDDSSTYKSSRKHSKKSQKSTYKDSNGYLRYSDSDKLVHRVAAEKKFSRNLKPGEVVHHINRKKTDNRPSNLWIFKNQESHSKAHKYDAKKYGKKASYKGFLKKFLEDD